MIDVVVPVKILRMIWQGTLAFCLIFWCMVPGIAAPNIPEAKKGVLDLQNWDFRDKGALEIAGEWEFIWNEFIPPGASSLQTQTPDYIQVPGTWLGYQRNEDTLGKYGYATFRLKILMPEKPRDLGLYLKRVQDAYKVYINGKLWMQSGTPAQTADNAEAKITREFSSLKGITGNIELIIHVSNYSSYAGGGFFNSFTIGPEGSQYRAYLFDIGEELFLSGALTCLGIFMVTLHWGRRREKSYFVLYVLSFFATTYVMTTNALLSELVPVIPYHWGERLGYISGAFMIALTYEFIHQFHPRKLNSILSTLILYQAAAISICIILWPGGLPVELIYVLGLHLLVQSIASGIEIWHIVKNKVPGGRLIMMGVGTLVFVGVHDLLNANGLILSIYLAPYGILLLLFFFAAILAFWVNASTTQNERLAKAIWAMNDCVAIFDGRNQLVIWNDAYFQHLTAAAQKILKPGISFLELVRADAHSGELQSAIGRENEYIRERMQHYYNPGETFEMERKSGWYLYRKAETPDGGRVTLASDLSSQKAKELELQLALQELVAANAAKNSFLSNMTHELRTPLNAINGFSDMMVQQVLGPLNEQYREYAEHISRSGKHLLRLVTDMLDVARIETGKLEVTPEAFNLPGLLEDCIRTEMGKLEARKLVFSRSIPQDLPPLYADPVRVRQIVLNLLDNAIKFTKPGGKVSLRVKADLNGALAISIEDTGVGIAEEDFEKVLQKFGQIRQSHLNAHEGLGLGLSIAEILMQRHGGRLELNSKLAEGTQVTAIFLPKDEAEAFFRQ